MNIQSFTTKFWRRTPSWLISKGFKSFTILGKRFWLIRTAAFFLVVAFLFAACKKKELIGLEVQPDSEKLGLYNTDTISLIVTSIEEDSIRSDETTFSLLGSYNDPEFGYAEAGIYTQVRLSASNVDFGDLPNLVVDSLILSLQFLNYYGGAEPQNFNVYSLTEDIEKDSIYYSAKDFAHEPVRIGGIIGFVPNLNDSISVGTNTEPAQIRMRLNKSYGSTLLNANEATYASNEAFLLEFKGFFIQPVGIGTNDDQPGTNKVSQSPGKGAIFTIDMLSAFSRLTLYYHDVNDNDPLEFEYYINDQTAHTNRFIHDYAGTPVQAAFNNPVTGEQRAFVQPMAGVKTRVEIPYLENLIASGPVAINKAELLLPIENGSTTEYSAVGQLFATGIDSAGNATFLADQFYNESHYGGTYDLNNSQYSFVITRHIQSLLNSYREGDNRNFGIYLVAGGAAVTANRSILNGTKTVSNSMKLILSYTPL